MVMMAVTDSAYGDVAVMDDKGFICIADRKKDMISGVKPVMKSE